MPEPRVLMVCLGNICRSPMAEGLLKHRAAQLQIPVFVDSAGTSGNHAGELPDARMRETALQYGIDLSDQRSRKFRKSDFSDFDFIFTMDRSNQRNVLKLANGPADEAKVDLIMNLVSPGQNLEVPDPYFGGKDGFHTVYSMLDQAITAFLNNLR
jgi:protein-tyrosine phosphatase